MSSAGAVAGPPRSTGRDFAVFWTGQALSQFGEQISLLAIPVTAVLLLHATTFEVGVLGAASTAAFLVLGLPAGAWIDRMRKRRVMIAADAVRAVTLAAVPVLRVLDALRIGHLIAIALLIGVATVFFDVSYQSIVPALVPPQRLAAANGRLEGTAQVARLGGPAAAGWLIGVVTAPIAVAANAATYAASFAALLLTRDAEEVRPAAARAPLSTEIAEGLRWVFGHPLLRRIVGTTAASNLATTIGATLVPLFLLRTLGFTPVEFGVVLSLGAVGGLLGAASTAAIGRVVGEARLIPLSALVAGAVALLLPVAAAVPSVAFPLLVAQEFVLDFAVIVYNVTQVSFRQRITPARLLGRMNASIRFVVWGVMPISALAAGGLATWFGIVPALWIGAVGDLAAAAFVVSGPFWRLRDLPPP